MADFADVGETMNKTLLLIIPLILIAIACTPIQQQINQQTDNANNDDNATPFSGDATQELKKFNNRQELVAFLSQNTRNSYYAGYDGMMLKGSAMMETAVAAPRAESDSAGDYSQTNVQVAGVDEADFVKNDGKYIYVLTQDKFVIVDAFPAEQGKILSQVDLKGTPVNLFLNEDRLAIFVQDYDDVYTIEDYDFVPRPRTTQTTHVYIYDISDRENPEEVDDYALTGSYYQSRMIGDYVYFIVQEYPYYYGPYIDMPLVKEAGTTILRPDVYYFDNPEDNYVFTTVASFNIKSSRDIFAKTFLTGYTHSVYVSENNIYLTYQKNPSSRYYESLKEDRFNTAVVPVLPESVQRDIKSIQSDSSLNSYEQWDAIRDVLEAMYNTMSESEKDNLVQDIEASVEEFEVKRESALRKTVIQKIAIHNGAIDYQTKGEVSGYPLNQFSMDENDGYFRIATTTEFWTNKGSVLYNNVYVLDEGMDVMGKIENLAEDERIYATRFMGDRLYMVTFKRIDPLFVIDLSDPTEPSVLGMLKIPGFSDYLHPYDENHVIGLGKETEGNEWGGVSVKGVKLALFDVTDVDHPKQVDMVEIGLPGTDSEAIHDHKAFLFDKNKNLLVIPIRELKESYTYRYGYPQQKVWQGAYVYTVTEDGFSLKGKISHYEGDEESRWYWSSPSAVKRALFMDDVLYTISAKYIKMNDLATLDALKEIKLPFAEQDYYPLFY
ncbi:copper amine oxidase [Candidatus Woesearchaeota archaeon]|nr:MAG: copper amine oxidase [Candidatus Woesearchaeota archaeon]